MNMYDWYSDVATGVSPPWAEKGEHWCVMSCLACVGILLCYVYRHLANHSLGLHSPPLGLAFKALPVAPSLASATVAVLLGHPVLDRPCGLSKRTLCLPHRLCTSVLQMPPGPRVTQASTLSHFQIVGRLHASAQSDHRVLASALFAPSFVLCSHC